MKAKLFALTAAAVVTLTGLGAEAQPRPYANPARAEAIYGATFDDRGLTLRVSSNGCTRKEDFAVRVRREGRVKTVSAVRIREDRCRAFMRSGVNLTWSLAELGIRKGEDVRLLNPLNAW